MTEYYKENFYNEYAIKKEDTIIAIVDSGSNARKICDELNALHEENNLYKEDVERQKADKKLLIETANDLNDKIDTLQEENEQLKQALREQLEENGNAYSIKVLDKIFDLKYDEWQRKMNETHTYDYIDWEKVLKDKGDDGND